VFHARCVQIALLLLALLVPSAAVAQMEPDRAPAPRIAVETLPPIDKPVHFDAEKATAAYLAQIKGQARANSDSYFEGGYVLQVVDTIWALAVSALLLWGKWSAAIRDWAQARTRSRFWQAPIYVAIYTVVTTVLTFPLTVYENFFREHAYGLSNQNFLQWFRDFAVGFGFSLVGSVIVLTLIYTAIRWTRERWWVWGTGIAVLGLFFLIMVTPVFVAPAFNDYKQLPDSPLRRSIVQLADANGIPDRNIYVFDASKQSNRVSANVSGLFGTTQISMTDNLIKQGSPQMVMAVLGHEMGHYVLNHSAIDMTWIGLLLLVAFGFVNWAFRALTDIFGGNWDVRTIDDPAGLPVLMAALNVFFLVATPVQNTIIRTTEAQADIFGLNASRQPDGFAQAALKLSNYRKLEPSALEEFIFYDHPSGRSRIHMAMQWKAAHINDPDIKAGPVSPE
jgi:STE24 endopeptidase